LRIVASSDAFQLGLAEVTDRFFCQDQLLHASSNERSSVDEFVEWLDRLFEVIIDWQIIADQTICDHQRASCL
jgi:hypothetical protein